MVRYETNSVRKVMPTVSNTSTNPVQASGSSSQSFTTSDPSITNAFTVTTHFQGAGIAGYAAAQAGSVHAWARNGATATPPAILDPDGVSYLPSPFSVIASIAVSARAEDFLTVNSGTLAKGTPVTFTWNTYADASE